MDYQEIKSLWNEQVSPQFTVQDAELCFSLEKLSKKTSKTDSIIGYTSGFFAILCIAFLVFWSWIFVSKGFDWLVNEDLLPPTFLIITPLYVGSISLYVFISYIQRRFDLWKCSNIKDYAQRTYLIKKRHVIFLRYAPWVYLAGTIANFIGISLDPRFPVSIIAYEIVFILLIFLWSKRALIKHHLPELKELERNFRALENL
ncbi:hypothetical protein MLD52_00685 [Puniceicoccaceae bacterium K14]|nr:hypothetical protein [Puniceicoccaceae bacterium K14]